MTTNNNPLGFGFPSEEDILKLITDIPSERCAQRIHQAEEAARGNYNITDASGALQGDAETLLTSANVPTDIDSSQNDYQSLADRVIDEAINASLSAGTPYVPGNELNRANNESKFLVEESSGYSPVVVSAAQADDYHSVRNNDSNHSSTSFLTNKSGVTVGGRSIESIRNDFPILEERVNGHQLVWFDNGATTQRPEAVISRIDHYYRHENSNVHRAAHELAARSTDAYENARQTVADFIGAPSKDNIVWVRGTTEGINLVAQSYVRPLLRPGDEIIVSILEHHANIVPWQLVAQATGAVIKVIPINASGDLDLKAYASLFTPRTRFVSVTQVSNTLGTITPVEELVQIAHSHSVPIMIDGAQSIAHLPVNVSASGADFFVFSGHKVYGPNGIGAVYGRKELWEEAQPYHGGGNMIRDVTFERTIYNQAPNKFEAGTGSIADAVGLGAALDYLSGIGMHEVARYEHELTTYAVKELSKVKGLTLVGRPLNKSGVLSFVLDGHSISEVGSYLNSYGIAVRAGHHCAQPVLRHLGYEGTVRPVLGLYNTPEEIDYLVKTLYAIR